MNKASTKRLFFLSIFTLFLFKSVFAQTITVGAVDAGPYSQGSTISVPININDAGGCIKQDNTFNVYLSDASGNFTPGTLIGSYAGFYAGFVNATIPNGTPVGTGYKVEVVATDPAVTSSASSAFAVKANSGVTASVTSTLIGTDPNVFGRCVGIANATFNFNNTSSAGTTTLSFFNEQTQTYEVSNMAVANPGSYTFTAATSNYTVTVKNVDASGNVSTKSYQLINNVIQNNFGSAGNGFVCLTNGKGVLSYTIATTGPSGISANYPGNTYVVNWGDGSSTTYTECEIAALGGVVSHTFTLPSCNQTGSNGVANAFLVQNQATSPYCGVISAPPGISAKVLITPITSFTAPAVACINSGLTIPNTSQPGPDPNATSPTCNNNPGQLYDWSLDGVPVAGYQGVPLATSFVFPASMASGTHTLTLHSELPSSGIGCQAADYTQTICFEQPPIPSFTIAPEACAGTAVTPANTSVSFNVCSTATYNWSAAGPGTVSYTGGTSATSKTPQMVFSAAGIYTVQLAMASGCGTITTTQIIYIDGPPTISLSPAFTLCNNPQTVTFDPTQTATKTIFGGTTVAQATSYTWTVTGGAYSFVGGTNANSEYPQITFNDLTTYTVSVTNVNTCGSATASQLITLAVAPIVNAGPDQTVCASAPATTLAGSITGTYSSYQWVGGAGTFNPNRTTFNAVYTPSTGEIAAGSVVLTLQGNASNPSPCNIATDNITINITPKPAITSATTTAACSKQPLAYTIKATQTGVTFTWTAAASIGTPTGFTALGSGSSITDVITNTSNIDEVVTYLITPTLNGCPGNVFALKATIHPLPVITAAPVTTPICSNVAANIALSSNVANTTYTWTSSASAGITGNTNQATAKTTTSIQDVLVNTNANPGTVTYTVTPYNGTCAGPAVITSITVEPSPVISNAGPDAEICSQTSYTLQGNSASPGTGKWTVSSASIAGVITFSDATDPHAVVSGLVPGGIYQFQWTTSYYVSCPSSSSIVKITDDTAPIGGTTSSPATVCTGSNSGTITLTGQSGTVTSWQSSVDGGASWQTIANTNTNQPYLNLTETTQFRAVIGNGVCTYVESSATIITVDPAGVTANAGANNEVCNSTTYTLQGNNPSPGTGVWTEVTGPAGATFSDPTNPNAVVSNLIPGSTYQFKWTIAAVGTCPANSSTVSIIIDKPPVGGTTAGTSEVCTGSNNGQITLSGQFGTVVRWESSINGGSSWQAISNTGVTQSYSNLTQTTEFRAILQNGIICPTAPSTATTVTVDTPPVTSNAGPTDEVCSTTTYTLQGNNPSPGTGMWTVVSGPAGATFSDPTNPDAVVSNLVPGSVYQFQWTIKNTGVCAPSTNSVNIAIDKSPVGGTTSSNATVCTGSNSAQITLAGQFGTVVRWESSIDGGTSWQPIANTSTSLSYLNLTQTTEYRAVLHNGVCTDAPSAPTTITVVALPVVANAGPTDEVCGVTAYTLQGNDPSPGTGLWTVVSGPAGTTFSNATSPNATVTGLISASVYQFKWTISGVSSSCPPTSSTVTITIDKKPVGGTTSGATTVCTGSNAGDVTLAGQFGTIIRWEMSSDNGVTWVRIANTTATLSYSNLTQTTEYRAVLHSSNTCLDVISSASTITVAPMPITSVAGSNDEVCGVTSYTLQGNSPTPGTGLWTVVSGPAGVTFSNATSPNAVANGLIPGSVYQFEWTITTSVTCPSNSSTVTITIDKPPVGGTATANPTEVCYGSNGGQVTLAGQFGTVFGWQMSTDNGTTWQPIGNSSTTQSFTNLTQNTEYRAILHNSTTCADVFSTPATIIVDPMPVVSNPGLNDEVCNTTTYTLQGNNPSPGTGKWTISSGPAGATFSDATNPNATVSGLIPGNIYQFKWTISSSSTSTCPPSSNTVNITIDAQAVGGNTSGTAEVCSGSNGGTITIAGQVGSVVQWESSIDNGVTWQPITNATASLSYLNLTQTTIYRADVHNGTTCGSVSSTTTTITVDPPPTTANAGTDDEVCSVTTYTLNGNNPGTGTGKWTVNNGPAGAIFSDVTNPSAIVSGLVPGNIYQFKWTITGTSASCPPSAATVNITIDKAPVGGTTLTNATVCSGSNTGQITLSGQFGTILRWESSIDGGANWQPITNTGTTQAYSNLTQTTIYRAVLHNGSICADVTSTTTTITVNDPPPVSNAGSDAEVCSVTTYMLHGDSPSPGTGLWTVNSGPSGAIFSDATNPNATVMGLIPGNVYQFKWTITGSASCPPSSALVNITIDKAPVGGVTSSNATVCSGSNTGQMTLSGQFGTIVRWEFSTDGGTTWQPIANTGTTQAYSNLTQTTLYRAVLHNGAICADVASATTTITVDAPPPVANAGSDAEVCSVTTYALQGNNPSPATGLWSVNSGPAGAIFSDATNPNATVSGLIPGSVYQFKWTITGSASCPSNSAIVNITIDKAPIGGTTSSNATVCSGSNTGQITLAGQFGTIARWEFSTDGGTTWQPIANTGTSQSYLNLTQTTEYRAVLHNSNTCADVASTATTITVDAPPVVANAGSDAEVCSVTTYTLNGNSPGTATGLWTINSGPTGAVFSDATNPSATVSGLIPGSVYQFKWTITGSASCPPSSAIVNITIDKAPVGGTTSSDATVCSGSNTGQIALAGQFGTIVRWEFSTDGGTIWQPIANTGASQSYLNLTQTTEYRAVLHNSTTCADVASSVTTITVDAPPPVANAGTGAEVCNVTTYTLQGNTPSPATGKWTIFTGPAGATFVDDTAPNAVVNGLIPGNAYQFKWTITGSASCPSSSSIVTIIIDQPPVGGTTSSPATVCSGSNNGSIVLAGQFGTITRWESSIDNGTTWQPIANTNTTQSYFNLTQTTEYRAVLQNGVTCAAVTSTITIITVDQPPVVANAGPANEVCSVTTYTLQGNSPGTGTGQWTIQSGPAGATFSNDASPNATVSGLIPGNVYQFQWTIIGSASCPPSSDVVNITIDKAPIGGTTSSPAEVCSGSNTGQINLLGQFGTIVRWESSVDGGATWQPIANTVNSQTYFNLTQTTQYRAVLHNSVTCADVASTATTITVDLPPIAADAGSDDEVCGVTVYTLNGNSPGTGTGKWSVLNGPAGVTFSDATNPNAVANGLIPGSVYQFEWTITGTASCPPTTDIATITIDKAPIGGTTTTPTSEVCYGNNAGEIDLNGQFGSIIRWEFSTDNGATWQPISNTNNTYRYSDLTQTTQFRGVLHNGSICGDVVSTSTTVIVDPLPVASVPGPNAVVCNVTTYTLQGNNPAPGTGKWTVVQGPAGATFSDDTNPNAVVNGLIPGSTYVFNWAITGSISCPSSNAVVTIAIDKAPIGGTTSGLATVCWGSNAGQVTLTGQFGTIVRWESSIDNGATWQPVANSTTTQTYLNLTRTTEYHAILHNGTSCDDVPSTPTTITVNDPTPVSQAGTDFSVCNQTIVTLTGNAPGVAGGLWTQTAGPAVNIVTPSNSSTQVTGLSGDNTYTFKWTIFGLPPCVNTESVINVSVHTDVVPSFTMNKSNGCGPTTVTFTNTSLPTPTSNDTFVWNFGDGSPSVTAVNPPPHTFPASSDGTEETYDISLTPTSNCGSQTPFVAEITVSSLVPVAVLLPSQTGSCGTFTLTAKNLSPGDNVSYDFYLVDQNGALVQKLNYPDKEDAVFKPVTPTQPTHYELYLIVTDKCGNQAKSTPIDIFGAPSTLTSLVQIKGDITSVCLGSPITFQNISTGGDEFTITIYDANKNQVLTIPAGTGDLSYIPTAIGTYYVSITAGYVACGEAPVSALKEFTVYPDPVPSFTYTSDEYYNVTFINTTPAAGNIPASSLIYNWDFGDGTPNETSFNPNVHHFNFANSPFKVTLTATTPGTTCLGVTSQILDIKFHGNIYVPNAFMPASSKPELRTFYVKGFGMKTWHMQVFNNFGQLLWESYALDSNGVPTEGWDGTYKGKIVEQGVYIWQISGTLLNGEPWKGMSYGNGAPSRTGAIHLIR